MCVNISVRALAQVVGCAWMQGYLIARPLPAEHSDVSARAFDWPAFKAEHNPQGHSPQ